MTTEQLDQQVKDFLWSHEVTGNGQTTPARLVRALHEALTAALAAPIEVERPAEWVPVAERLPELREGIWSDNVLVVLENGTHTLAQLLSGSRWFLPFSGHAVFEVNPVTHWMPLPSPPIK